MLMITFLVLAVAWAAILTAVIALCINAARGDRQVSAPAAPDAVRRHLRAVA